MDPSIAAAIITVLGTGFGSLIGAILFGKLVPSSRVSESQRDTQRATQDADKWRLAYEQSQRTQLQQEKLLERAQLTAEITDNVMRAVKDSAAGKLQPGGGGGQ